MAILESTCFEPPIGISREDDSLKHSNSLSFSFWVTMVVMIASVASIKEQLVEMTHVISKLTKIIKEKVLQIDSLMNKVDTWTQNTTDSSHEFTHPPRVASQGDSTNAFKLM